MARRYIDRDALIAKIEKAIDSPAPSHDQQCDWEDGYWCGLSKAECIIDTLEVKEVDLTIHTIIEECCDWLAICTDLSLDLIEDCRNLMLAVKDEQLKVQKGK